MTALSSKPMVKDQVPIINILFLAAFVFNRLLKAQNSLENIYVFKQIKAIIKTQYSLL